MLFKRDDDQKIDETDLLLLRYCNDYTVGFLSLKQMDRDENKIDDNVKRPSRHSRNIKQILN